MENELEQNKYEHGHKLFKKSFVFFFVLFLIVLSFWSGYEQGKNALFTQPESIIAPEKAIILNKNNRIETLDFGLFWKVWDILKDKYVDRENLDARKLLYGAIDGMLSASGDPYTTFFDPEESKEFQEDISGTFEGIGAEMGIKNEVLTIIAPLEGMPAEKAGIMTGDKVIKINNESTANMSVELAVSKIRGPKGTEVKLTIFRYGEEETRDITVKRDVIIVKSVRFETKENNIAYIRVNRFGNDDTEKEFRSALRQTISQKSPGLIIDLRNNPGGYLETAIKMANLMLPSGKIIVIEENAGGERDEIPARGGDVLSQLQTVVLINEGSASASEILAGALRDNRKNVTLVGKKSFGKGSVQEVIPLNNNKSVKITVARWLTPTGNQINDTGIAPDIEINLTRDDIDNKRDPQLDKAIEVLTSL